MIDKYIAFLLLMLLYGLYDRFKGIEKRKGIVIGYKYLPCFKVRLDTQKYPHIIITGITGVGKTKLAEYIVKDKKPILINCYKEDFTSIEATRINDLQEIISFLNAVPKNSWIVIDELNQLCSSSKEASKLITNLLFNGRHAGINVIGICQRSNMKDIDCGNLFNVRIAGKHIKSSDYLTTLGISVDGNIGYREFYLVDGERMEVFKSYEIK